MLLYTAAWAAAAQLQNLKERKPFATQNLHYGVWFAYLALLAAAATGGLPTASKKKLEPLGDGDAQKARTCCHHLSVLVLLLSECSRFRPDKKAFDFFGYFPWFSLSFATPFVT